MGAPVPWLPLAATVTVTVLVVVAANDKLHASVAVPASSTISNSVNCVSDVIVNDSV